MPWQDVALFEDCIGAIDGTLIYASVKNEDRDRDGEDGAFRCRKGFLTQNVLGRVDFDMNFLLVYGGWEGTVFNSARERGLFFSPAGKYWLLRSFQCYHEWHSTCYLYQAPVQR
jgi:hypothetical protein